MPFSIHFPAYRLHTDFFPIVFFSLSSFFLSLLYFFWENCCLLTYHMYHTQIQTHTHALKLTLTHSWVWTCCCHCCFCFFLLLENSVGKCQHARCSSLFTRLCSLFFSSSQLSSAHSFVFISSVVYANVTTIPMFMYIRVWFWWLCQWMFGGAHSKCTEKIVMWFFKWNIALVGFRLFTSRRLHCFCCCCRYSFPEKWFCHFCVFFGMLSFPPPLRAAPANQPPQNQTKTVSFITNSLALTAHAHTQFSVNADDHTQTHGAANHASMAVA